MYRSGTSTLPDWASPYSIIQGEEPRESYVPFFGAKVVFHQGDSHKSVPGSSKALQNIGLEGVFIGIDEKYPTGTYTIYDTITHKVVHSNNVVFLDDQNITNTEAWKDFQDDKLELEEFTYEEEYKTATDANGSDDSDVEKDNGDSYSDDESYDGDVTSGRESEKDANGSDDSDVDYDCDVTRRSRSENFDSTVRPKRFRRAPTRYDPVVGSAKPQWRKSGLLSMQAVGVQPTLLRSDHAAMNDPVFGDRWRKAKAKELAQFDRF